MKEKEVHDIRYYIKVGKFYYKNMMGSEVILTKSKEKFVDRTISRDDIFKEKVAKRIAYLIEDLVRMGFSRADISVEAVTDTTVTDVEKVKIVEKRDNGVKVYKIEKEKSKISSGMVSIDLNEIVLPKGALLNGISFHNSSPAEFSDSFPVISTQPPHWTTWKTHPNNEELNEYDIVKFNRYFPHMNVRMGDMGVVVKVDIDTVMVKKDGSTFPIARHHVSKVKN